MRRQTCHRCFGELSGVCVEFQGKSFHRDCFRCKACGTWVQSNSFSTHEGDIYCSQCYQRKFGKYCKQCKEPIKGEYILVSGKAYHSTCFRCEDCHSLVGTPFYRLQDRVLCKADYVKRVEQEMMENGVITGLVLSEKELQCRSHSKVTVNDDFHLELKCQDQDVKDDDVTDGKKGKGQEKGSTFTSVFFSCIGLCC